MKTLVISIALALFTPALLLAQPASKEDPAHQELRTLRDGLLAAMNSGQIEKTLSYLDTNCVITWHNAEVSRGHEGVRAYHNRVMTGPDRIIDSFHCDVTVDELTHLYGDTTGVCFGSSDEHFKLKNGKDLEVKGRWTATLIKTNGRWLIASLHASTNLFDNVMLDYAKRAGMISAIVALVVGVVGGWFIGRRRKKILGATT